MALPLESTIMRKIGFGHHYNWYNGSGSCRYIRQQAADALPRIIQKHHEDGDEIASPDPSLISLLKRIAVVSDGSEYRLTKTWEAASYMIAHHIHVFQASDEDASEATTNLTEYLTRNYLPKSTDWLSRIKPQHDRQYAD